MMTPRPPSKRRDASCCWCYCYFCKPFRIASSPWGMQGAGCRDARGGHATFSAGEGRREFGFSFGLFLRSSTGRERVEASEFFPPTFFFFLLLHASLLLERSRPPSPLLDILSTRFLCVCTVIRSKRERRKNELSLLHRSTLPLFLLLFLAARHLPLFLLLFSSSYFPASSPFSF